MLVVVYQYFTLPRRMQCDARDPPYDYERESFCTDTPKSTYRPILLIPNRFMALKAILRSALPVYFLWHLLKPKVRIDRYFDDKMSEGLNRHIRDPWDGLRHCSTSMPDTHILPSVQTIFPNHTSRLRDSLTKKPMQWSQTTGWYTSHGT